MAIHPKSSQELAAQIMDAEPYFSGVDIGEQQAKVLTNEAKALQSRIEEMRPYTMDEEALASQLTDEVSKARKSGVWQPHLGESAEERVQNAVEWQRRIGSSEEEATIQGLKNVVRHNGYLAAIREKRREQEDAFREPIEAFIQSRELDSTDEKARVQQLLERTVDISTLSETEQTKLNKDFPSGNFLYHGTGTEQLIKILSSGDIANARMLQERENQAADREGRDKEFIRESAGYEGVSWSMNGIDALPGDRYHMVGFVAAPETILDEDHQLTTPSRPAPNEVLQVAGNINASEYYAAKTQFELFRGNNLLGEANAVIDSIATVRYATADEAATSRLQQAVEKDGILAQPDYQTLLRKNYSITDDGQVTLNPDLLKQVGTEIPTAAVWIQAAIDTGRLDGTSFANKSVKEIIRDIDAADANSELIGIAGKDWAPWRSITEEVEKNIHNISVPVEKMWFVAPRKDAERWLKVLARSDHQPKGVLLYDDKQVRLENFADEHRGDHDKLTEQLQTAITPNKGYIPYDEVLGTKFREDMRRGHANHVIGERYLSNRAAIKKIDGELVVEKSELVAIP